MSQTSRKLRALRRRGLIFVAPAALIGGLLVAAPAAAQPESEADVIVLAADQQTQIARPTLDAIKADAAQRGVPLEAALDEYLSGARMSLTGELEPDGPADTPEVNVDDLTAGELEDLRLIAAQDGISFEEAVAAHGWQGAFNDVADEIEASYGTEFSGAARSQDGKSAWFAFKGEVPEGAVALARKLPVEVKLQGGRGFTEADLEQASLTARDQVAAKPEVAGVATWYDIETGTIGVGVRLQPSIARDASAIERITPPQPQIPGVGLAVSLMDEVSAPEDKYIRGGGLYSGCTAGFNLKYKSSNTKRQGTAGHCARGSSGANQTYSNHSQAGGSTTIKRVWKHEGRYGDLAYYTTGSKTPTRTFYHNWNKTRYATERGGRPRRGTRICHFGMTTGGSCASVANSVVNVGEIEGMVQMDRNVSAPGDSGGPWFYGGTAYGVHYGKVGGKSTFTPTLRFDSARDYQVWIK
ncbi:hypothetical protein ABZ912_32320 [Nonomuraea angiospora]|uniref:hypothetical protein n=1 Tax=Nonomuraea angiospora TaxID=46172 RepID=UPI003408579C